MGDPGGILAAAVGAVEAGFGGLYVGDGGVVTAGGFSHFG